MGKKVFSTLVIIITFIVFDYIYFNFNVYFGNIYFFSILYFVLCTVLIFLLLEIILYNKLFNLKSGKFRIIILTLIPLIISMLLADRLLVINNYYFYSKKYTVIDKNLWKFDKLLGWRSIPNSTGSHNFYLGDSIKGSTPVIFDSIGFRTVPDSLKLRNSTLDLYVGCSFTFGNQIKAQYSFSYLTSKLLNHNYINAGASGYGLGQMIQLVESLTKRYHFKYVFIQLSPWLAERAMVLNGPTEQGYRPCPYFSDYEKRFKLNPPAYSTLRYKFRNWRESKPSYIERIEFIFSDGIKTKIHDFYNYQFARLKTKIGILPKPTNRNNDLEKYFYDYTINICKKNNAIPIILKMGYPWPTPNQCIELLEYLKTKAEIIDLDFDLEKKVNELGNRNKTLVYVYTKYRNSIIVYDKHPNEFVNKLYSERIYIVLNSINIK
jgi:hypothetical protein